jgi:glycosyltransferase involved in cell wall biosynthesis
VSAEIAVVVPARNAAATIGRTLAALAVQDLPAEAEVVVVDDASEDETVALAERAAVRVVRHERPTGPAGARNTGVAATTAPLIAFTDADCEPATGWLRALVAALRSADLITGPIEPAGPAGLFDRTLRRDGASPLFETANLAVRRAAFERVGGFAPFAPAQGSGHFGEDVVFGWRAVASGARTAYEPGAVVRHAVFARGPRGFIAERERLRFFPALVHELPELRASLPGRMFLSRRTLRFDAALAGVALAAATRGPVPLLLAAPYAWRELRGASQRERVALIAADAVGFAALVRGAVSARCVVL